LCPRVEVIAENLKDRFIGNDRNGIPLVDGHPNVACAIESNAIRSLEDWMGNVNIF
jgi:hypothetical protein